MNGTCGSDLVNGSLTSIPATDLNFKSALQKATAEQIEAALSIMRNRNGKDKARIVACERELKRRTQKGTL